MGYFNFYFLKKLIAYFEKNKKFIITFAIFVLIMFIRAKCFAAFIFTEGGTTYTFPDLPFSTLPSQYEGYFIYFDNSTSRYYIVYTPKGSKAYFSANGAGANNTPNSLVVNATSSHNGTNNSRYYTISNGSSWTYQSLSADSSGFWFSNFNSTNTGNRRIIYSTVPIYTSPNFSTIYFQTELFNQLPYFLNSAEDIAIGGQDLIIMPRRFSKQ